MYTYIYQAATADRVSSETSNPCDLLIFWQAFDVNAITLPPGVARMKRFDIPSKLVGRIIGPGGATINAIIAETGVGTYIYVYC